MRDTIDMASEVLDRMPADSYCREPYWTATDDELKEFEALVRADEREACANLLDSTDLSAMSADPKLQNWTAALLFQYAAAIRARGENK